MSTIARKKLRITAGPKAAAERAAERWAAEQARVEENIGFDPRNHRGSRCFGAAPHDAHDHRGTRA